jgi:hypothetical protein
MGRFGRLVNIAEQLYLGAKEAWIPHNFPVRPDGHNSIHVRDIDLVVRTYNVLEREAAEKKGFHKPYNERLDAAARLFLEDWKPSPGIVALQEAADSLRLCEQNMPGDTKVTTCLAVKLGKLFGRPMERATTGQDLGITWPADDWLRMPGGGVWKLPPIKQGFMGLNHAHSYIQAIKLIHRQKKWRVTIVNTHLAHNSWPAKDGSVKDRSDVRARQLDKLLPIIDGIVTNGELPPILVGDFNFDYHETPNVRRVQQRFSLANAPGIAALSDGRPTRTSVDHIWTGRPDHFSRTAGEWIPVRVHVGGGNDSGLEFERHGISDHASPAVSFRIVF